MSDNIFIQDENLENNNDSIYDVLLRFVESWKKMLGLDRLTCCICDFSCRAADKLERHLKVKHDPDKTCNDPKKLSRSPFKCFLCDFICDNSFGLYHHLNKKHNGDSVDIKAKTRSSSYHKCKLCKFRSIHLPALRRHVSMKHRHQLLWLEEFLSNPDQYKCSLCSWVGNYARLLEFHLRDHCNDKKEAIELLEQHKIYLFTCKLCNRKTNEFTFLRKHIMRSHVQESFKMLENEFTLTHDNIFGIQPRTPSHQQN